MGNPFESTSVINYNVNPPPDDGSQTSTNLVKWSNHKSKLADPIKAAFDTHVTKTGAAFGLVPGGAGITTVNSNYAVASTDQGKLIHVTASATVTTPDATDTAIGAPFLFRILNDTSGDITFAGANPGVQQTIDGADSITIPAGAGVVCDTDGTNWFTGGQNYTKTQLVPQGRLTLVSGTPVMSADETAKTAVYFTPYQGDQVIIPNGTKFVVKEFSELTLTLNGTNYVASNIYDVFVSFNPADGSTIIIGSGPAWTTATAGSGARGTGAGTTEIALLKGLYVNNNAITLRNNVTTYSVALKCALYVGSIFIDTTNGQLNCHVSYGQSRKWDVWNAFNRVPVYLMAGDGTSSWNYTTATWRAANGSSANSLTIFSGLAEDIVDVSYKSTFSNTNTQSDANTGIGFNSTTSPSGLTGFANSGSTYPVQVSIPAAEYMSPPLIGINNFSALEYATAVGTNTWYGTGSGMRLLAKWKA